MDHLIVTALQEGGIDGADRLHPVRRQTGGEGHGVLFGDADIIGPLGEGLTEQVQPRARRHGGGDGHDGRIDLGVFDQFGPEHLGVAGGVGDGLGLFARHHVELDHRMEFVGAALGGGVALALLRHDVDQHRPVLDGGRLLQDRHQIVHVVTVDGADVIEAQLLEEGAAGDHAARIFLGLLGRLAERARQVLRNRLAQPTHVLIGAARHQPGQIGAHPADRGGNGHVVVVQNDHQLAIGRLGGVVHRLIGHAGGHGAVADHGHDAVLLALLIARGGEAQGGADGGRGVGRAEGIVFALAALGEARQAAALAQGADAVAPSGQDLVRIALVPDVPDQDVPGRLEHMMQRRGQLDHAQARAQMPAGDGHRVDGFGPHLFGQLFQLGDVEAAHIGGKLDGVEKRGVGHQPKNLGKSD